VTLLCGGFSTPVKYGFSGVMPAFISKMLGSLRGTSEKLGIRR
jgi:hypothetical protein